MAKEGGIGLSTGGYFEDDFQYTMEAMETEDGLPFFQVEEPNLDSMGKQAQYKRKSSPEELMTPEELEFWKDDPQTREKVLDTKDYWKHLPSEELRNKARDDAHQNQWSPPINRPEYDQMWKEERKKFLEDPTDLYKLSPKELKRKGITSTTEPVIASNASFDVNNYLLPDSWNMITRAKTYPSSPAEAEGGGGWPLGQTRMSTFHDSRGKPSFRFPEFKKLGDELIDQTEAAADGFIRAITSSVKVNEPEWDKWIESLPEGLVEDRTSIVNFYKSVLKRPELFLRGPIGDITNTDINEDYPDEPPMPKHDPFEAAAARVRAKHPTRVDPNRPVIDSKIMGRYIQHKAKQFFDAAVKVVKAPIEAYRGELDPLSDDAIKRMFDLAGTIVLGPAPLAGKIANGTLGSFIGAKAKLSIKDKKNLSTAEIMDNLQFSQERIWKKTGWFRGMDGEWRKEIESANARLSDILPPVSKLSDVLEYKELYEAYPFLKEVQVIVDDTMQSAGMYNANRNAIYINPELSGKLYGDRSSHSNWRDTILHEVQHAIQREEGFFSGTNANYVLERSMDVLLKRAKEARDEGDIDFLKEAAEIVEGIKGNKEAFADHLYMRDPGEIEARIVEGRSENLKSFSETPIQMINRLIRDKQHKYDPLPLHDVTFKGRKRYVSPNQIKFDKFDTYERKGVQHYGLEFNKIYKLENILDDKELYKQFPELRKIKVVRAADEGVSSFDAEKNILHLGIMDGNKIGEVIDNLIKDKK